MQGRLRPPHTLQQGHSRSLAETQVLGLLMMGAHTLFLQQLASGRSHGPSPAWACLHKKTARFATHPEGQKETRLSTDHQEGTSPTFFWLADARWHTPTPARPALLQKACHTSQGPEPHKKYTCHPTTERTEHLTCCWPALPSCSMWCTASDGAPWVAHAPAEAAAGAGSCSDHVAAPCPPYKGLGSSEGPGPPC